MRNLITSVVLLLATFGYVGEISAQTHWREASNDAAVQNTEARIATEGIEIYSKDGHIVVHLPHKAQVKVFTILGQLVSQAELNAGTSMLKMNSRGIYIVKVGNITQKVAM